MSDHHRTGRHPVALGALIAAGVVGTARASESWAVRRWGRQPPPFDRSRFEFPGISSSITTADGGTLYAVAAGQGPTIVLGHGIAGDHRHWAPVANRLVDLGHRVVVFDQRGHGRSIPGAAGFGIAGLAHDVVAVVTELGGDDGIVLGGHSMGGIGVQAVLQHEPDLFDRVRGGRAGRHHGRARPEPARRAARNPRRSRGVPPAPPPPGPCPGAAPTRVRLTTVDRADR